MRLPWPWRARRHRSPPALIPPGISLRSQPPMTVSHAGFYNLLRLAVQDQYFVLVQVPLWRLLEVQAPDEPTRRAFLGKIAFTRVDFVLVHPGSLEVVRVVEIARPPSAKQQARERLLDAVCKMAGLSAVRLSPRSSYTVPALAALLGLETDT